MGKTARKLKWHWFLSPLPTLSVWIAVAIASVTIWDPDFSSWFVYGSFVYVGVVVGWTLLVVLVVRRQDPKEALPPAYFIIFWIMVLIAELSVMAVFDYLGIGQFQTFGFL